MRKTAANQGFLGIDLETYSDVDLGKCGLYRYVEGDFHILLFAYAFDDEDVRVIVHGLRGADPAGCAGRHR